jgi:TPR repeat protein
MKRSTYLLRLGERHPTTSNLIRFENAPPAQIQTTHPFFFFFFLSRSQVCREDGSWGRMRPREQKIMDEVLSLWRAAAEQGNPSAQCNLGVCFDHGHGVEQDSVEAVQYFGKAAKQGCPVSQCNIAVSRLFRERKL